REINVVFHQFESAVYDDIHRAMWLSLPREVILLAKTAVSSLSDGARRLRLLDVGCGTGLSSSLIMCSPLAARIPPIRLLDTSAAMLSRASVAARRWNVATTLVEGTVNSLPENTSYDVVICSSVLHHIPDVETFLADVASRQRQHGLFLHWQDPHRDA